MALRKAVGECEDELCRQCGVPMFSELQLGCSFGSFLLQNAPWQGNLYTDSIDTVLNYSFHWFHDF